MSLRSTSLSQILSLSERLTEAQGGCESQADLNRRREAEMAKLRKLLEDVHTESEQSIHLMKKKHQVWMNNESSRTGLFESPNHQTINRRP